MACLMGKQLGVLWPVMITRPDCAFAIGILSQCIQNPRNAHWEALKRVMVYLGSTKDLWLTFGGRSQKLIEGFCDSDYANQRDSGLCLPFWPGNSLLELEEAANSCSFDSRSRICCSSSCRERGTVAARFRQRNPKRANSSYND